MGSLKRIADALEKQFLQVENLHKIYEASIEINRENLLISRRHLEMAEEKHAIEEWSRMLTEIELKTKKLAESVPEAPKENK